MQIVDHGQGDMVPENRAANDRLRRNAKAKQEQQAERTSAGVEQKLEAKKELSFRAGRGLEKGQQQDQGYRR